MVNNKQQDIENDLEDNNREEIQEEITTERNEVENEDLSLEEIEVEEENKLKSLREKLKRCDAEKKAILEETQGIKADFLNARRRLEEEKKRDRELAKIDFLERLLPLCDSFYMAMSNREVWNKVDESWRKGIEGINSQLQGILTDYSVKTLNPQGEEFDHNKHEALSTVPVTDKKEQDKVQVVIQMGYEMTGSDGRLILIRPARVIIGALES